MRLTCPACGAVSSLDTLLGHDSARTALVRALEQTPIGKRLIRYVALFRPDSRALSWDRTANLLTELLDMVEAARIERHSRIWAAPQPVWIAALDEILSRRDEGKLTLPLKSHGYLLEIIAGSANKAEAREETRLEDQRGGRTPVGGQAHEHRPPDERKPRPTSRAAGAAALTKAKELVGLTPITQEKGTTP